jgi:hypothetical protein
VVMKFGAFAAARRVITEGRDLDVAEADAGVEHGRDERVTGHVRVHAWHPHAGGGGQVFEPAGCGVAVHPGVVGAAQERSFGPAIDRLVDGPCYRRWQRDEHDLAALAADSQHAVAVFFADVADAGAACFEDSQPERAEQRDQGEVVRVRRGVGGGDQCFELQVAGAECRRLGRHGWPADVVGWRLRQDLVDDADAVEAD